MADVRPFRALRPKAELAAKICELPYDVMSSEEAREIAREARAIVKDMGRAPATQPAEKEAA